MEKTFRTFSILFCIITNAQNSSSTGIVNYEETFGSVEKNLFELHFCNNESIYEQVLPSRKGQTIQTIAGFVEPQIEQIYYTDIQKNIILFQEGIAFKAITVQEDQTKIDWKVVEETKTINNFLCQKATAVYKDNHYSVWFTLEIPISFGPWKFHGLPGLILEAYDDSGFYQIKATKLNLAASCEDVVTKIGKTHLTNPITMKKYIELRNNENEDIFNFYQSISPRDSYLKVETDYTAFLREPLK